MIYLALSLCVFLLIPSGGMAAEVPFVFEGKSPVIGSIDSDQLERSNSSSLGLVGVPLTTKPTNYDYSEFSVMGNSNASGSDSEKKVRDLSKIINVRVEPDNAYVHDLALSLAAKQSGDHTIDQVCEIYSYLKYGNSSKKSWSYVDDPRGSDYFNYASKSLIAGNAAGSTGAGDCDDFAIIMSSLIESIGGTTRIILARNNSSGNHAYAEVYLGQLNAKNNQVEDIIKWLEAKFDADKIYTHIDTDSKDVWLNLDWSANHPGGPFYPADEQNILWIRDKLGKTPLKVSEKSISVPKLIGLTPDKPSPQRENTVVIWTANTSDPHNNQILYKFFLNGHPVSKWTRDSKWVWITNDTDIGDNQIE
ncbi:MAG: transglutaminase-like domain-containing protein, partial [Methanotrichaceae archaeon]|nr:transglutaminase-like domain-containing protein [Methanotrichaceae archaeon]